MKLVKSMLVIVILLPIGMCIGSSVSQFPEKTERDRENQVRGDEIVAAIKDFRERMGRLPESMTELRAESETKLPALTNGQHDFDYEVTGDGFSLEFLESSFGMFSGDGYHRYRSESEAWDRYFP